MKPYQDCYRPESYWEVTGTLPALLRNVKGRARREMIIDFWKAGRADELEPGILGESRTEGFEKLERISPLFMGGEYLPDNLKDEVEIARVELDSTTFDVISIRARPDGDGIRYRVVDEYETEFVLPFETSEKPLTLGELTALIEGTRTPEIEGELGLNLVYTACNCSGDNLEEIWSFTHVRSDFYPGLEVLFERKADEWRQAMQKVSEQGDREG